MTLSTPKSSAQRNTIPVIKKGSLAVVLVEPRIPQNTGNIARLCVCAGAELFLIGDLGFRLTEKYLARAGMDYLEHIHIRHLPTFDALLSEKAGWQMVFLSSKVSRSYWDFPYQAETLLVFGREDRGLPQEILEQYPEQSVRIPMQPSARSLNLSNAVSIVLYEAMRQIYHTSLE